MFASPFRGQFATWVLLVTLIGASQPTCSVGLAQDRPRNQELKRATPTAEVSQAQNSQSKNGQSKNGQSKNGQPEIGILKAGIIGTDTSHSVAFTKILNRPDAVGPIAHVKVVAAFPGGSADIPVSINRVKQFASVLRGGYQVEIVESVEALLAKVDVVLLESVDGRKHLEQARQVIQAGKPLFIDKPLAASLTDAVAIVRLAEEHQVPLFSSSALRFTPSVAKANQDPQIGQVLGCLAYSPCSLEEHHPDLFWYGVHGVETLFTIMGPGCQTVVRSHTLDADVVTGIWKDGRVATYRGIRSGAKPYGALVFGSRGVKKIEGFDGYEPLVQEICRFFLSKESPVPPAETLEILAFMEAAQQSKRQAGQPISLTKTLTEASQNSQNK